jgi:hypothetical protein
MTDDDEIKAKEAEYGEKMIEVKLRFWTNDLVIDDKAIPKGQIVPKHAWAFGVVRMKSNKAHGIVAEQVEQFRSLLDVGVAIEKTLKKHGIVLHLSPTMKPYMAP